MYFNMGDASSTNAYKDKLNKCGKKKLVVKIPRNKLGALNNLWNQLNKDKNEKEVVGTRETIARGIEDEENARNKSARKTMNEDEGDGHEKQITHFKKRIIRTHSVTCEALSTSSITSDDDRYISKTGTRYGNPIWEDVSSVPEVDQVPCTEKATIQKAPEATSQQEVPIRHIEPKFRKPVNLFSADLSTQVISSARDTMKDKEVQNQSIGKHQLPTVVMPTKMSSRPVVPRRVSLDPPANHPNLQHNISSLLGNVDAEEKQDTQEQKSENSFIENIDVPKIRQESPRIVNNAQNPCQPVNPLQIPAMRHPQQYYPPPVHFPRHPYPNINQSNIDFPMHRSRFFGVPSGPRLPPDVEEYYKGFRGNMNHSEIPNVPHNEDHLNYFCNNLGPHLQVNQIENRPRKQNGTIRPPPPSYPEAMHLAEMNFIKLNTKKKKPAKCKKATNGRQGQNEFIGPNPNPTPIKQLVPYADQTNTQNDQISNVFPIQNIENLKNFQNETCLIKSFIPESAKQRNDSTVKEVNINIYEDMKREFAKISNNFNMVIDTIRENEHSRTNNNWSRAFFHLNMNKISSSIGEIEIFLQRCIEFAEKSKSNHDEHHIFYSLLVCMKDFTVRIRQLVNKARNNDDRKKNIIWLSNVEESFYKTVFKQMADYITSNVVSKCDTIEEKNASTSEVPLTSTINCLIWKQQEMEARAGIIVMPLVEHPFCLARCRLKNDDNKHNNCIEVDEYPVTQNQSLSSNDHKQNEHEDPSPQSKININAVESLVASSSIPKQNQKEYNEKPEVLQKEISTLLNVNKKQENINSSISTTQENPQENVECIEEIDNKKDVLKQIKAIEMRPKPKYKISEILCIEIDSDCDSDDEKTDDFIKKEPVVNDTNETNDEVSNELKRKDQTTDEIYSAKRTKIELTLPENSACPENLKVITRNVPNSVIKTPSSEKVIIEDSVKSTSVITNMSWKSPPLPQNTFKLQFPNTVISRRPELSKANDEIIVVDKGNVRPPPPRRSSVCAGRSTTANRRYSFETSDLTQNPVEGRNLKKSYSTPPSINYPSPSHPTTPQPENFHDKSGSVLNLSKVSETTPQPPLITNSVPRVTTVPIAISPSIIPVFPKLGSIYDESVKTDGFVSQIIKDQITCLSKKEALSPAEYVKEVEMLQRIATLPAEFKDFYIYITKVQILHKHHPIAFRLFLELLNQGGLNDYHKKFSEYTTNKRKLYSTRNDIQKTKNRKGHFKYR